MGENNTAQPGGCGNGSFIALTASSPDPSSQADNWVSIVREIIGFRTNQDAEDSLPWVQRNAPMDPCVQWKPSVNILHEGSRKRNRPHGSFSLCLGGTGPVCTGFFTGRKKNVTESKQQKEISTQFMLLQHEGAEHGANTAGTARVRGAPAGTSQAGDNQCQIRARLQLIYPSSCLLINHSTLTTTGPAQGIHFCPRSCTDVWGRGTQTREQASLLMQERRLYSHVNGKDAEQVVPTTHT